MKDSEERDKTLDIMFSGILELAKKTISDCPDCQKEECKNLNHIKIKNAIAELERG